jgi:hypothetical protein
VGLCVEREDCGIFDNKHLFAANNEIHRYNTRNNNDLHPALKNLTKYNKGPNISGIKVFNHLPQYLELLIHYPKHFKSFCIIILFTR